MMFKSTKRMPAEQMDRLTEDVGGENNAFTENDVTVFHEEVPSNHLQRLLWAEAERMASLKVDEANFHTERDVVKEEFRQRVLAEPYGEFGEFIQKRSFAEHPYKRPTIGNIAELDAATLDQVRAFHETFYRPDNATLIVVGDFAPAQLNAWVDEYFAPISKPDKPIPRVTKKEPPRSAPHSITEHDPKVPFPAIAATFLGPSETEPEYATWQVLEKILGGGDSSRLYRSLVYEKRLAQQVEFTSDLREDLGLPTFQVILASGVPVEKGRAALLDEIAKLSGEPVSERELITAKNQILAERLTEREKVTGKAQALGFAAVLLHDAERVNTELNEIQKVTAEQVQEVAKKYFTDANRLLVEYLPIAARKQSARK
jgi:zinc protease